MRIFHYITNFTIGNKKWDIFRDFLLGELKEKGFAYFSYYVNVAAKNLDTWISKS